MIEYIFFHQKPSELFCDFLLKNHIDYHLDTDQTDVEGLLISVSEDLNDSMSEKIERFYDELLEMDEALLIENPEDKIDQAGLVVTLKNGVSTLASIDPDVLNRMLTVVSEQEISEFIDAIVLAVDAPDQRSLCQR